MKGKHGHATGSASRYVGEPRNWTMEMYTIGATLRSFEADVESNMLRTSK